MATDSAPQLQKIGKYEVIDVLGAGGMGIVYRARDAGLNRVVAIKMLKRLEVTASQALQVQKFFSRELLATASLQHKNIVTVYESGEQNGDPYLVMEYLDGEAVSRIIVERRQMPVVEKLDILVQVCEGLQYAHDRNPQVIHRDVKPANVILLKNGTAKLVDFGIARIVGNESSVVQTGQLVGSLPYMSPEQINSIPIDHRTDIFSVGVLAYELLTYSLPFGGGDPGSVFAKILREDPEPLSNFVQDLPAELETCISRALAKKTQDRYQSAEEFGFDLLSVQTRIKQGMTADLIQRAESAVRRNDLERARIHLIEVTRLDRHHERANRLLAEVRKAIQNQQRAAQVVQMRSQAQVALAGQQYDEALACVEQALQLDPQDQASAALRDEINNSIAKDKAVRTLLRRAESALYAGDLDDATSAVQDALLHNSNDAEARALAAIVDRELAERARRSQIQSLVDSARHGIGQRQFDTAIESLRKAEELDPSDSNVRELLQWASRGQEQDQRRKELSSVTEEIDQALRAEDFSSAFTLCELALNRFPDDQSLIRLRSIAEKQKEVFARRRFVQEQSLVARDLLGRGEMETAIKWLEEALARFPSEPNLEALVAQARQQLQDQQTLVTARTNERAALQDMERAQKLAAEECATLQKAIDQQESVEYLEILSSNLKRMLSSMEFDEKIRQISEPILEQVRLRGQAKSQALAELTELRKSLLNPADTEVKGKASERVLEIKAALPREREIRDACEEIAEILDGFRQERARLVAQLTQIAEETTRVRIGEAEELLRHSAQISGDYAGDPQVGALVQQIRVEVDRRKKQLLGRVREIGQLESAAADARSLDAIAQLLQNANAIGSLDPKESAIVAALERANAAGDRRRHAIRQLLGEIQDVTDKCLAAQNIGEAERLLEEAQSRASAHCNVDEIERILLRVSAQIRGRRVEHDLICEELNSLKGSVPDIASLTDLEVIRQRAADLKEKYSADQTIVGLCSQLHLEIQSERDRLLQAEIARHREELELRARQPQVEPQEVVSFVRRLQDLVRDFPESVELRSMLLKAEEGLTRSERARQEKLARKAALEIEVKACAKLLQSRSPGKALSAIEEAAAKYPESQQLQAMLAQCRDATASEEQVQRETTVRNVAIQTATEKAKALLDSHRSEEAVAILEVACQEWPEDKHLQRLLKTAIKSARRESTALRQGGAHHLVLDERAVKPSRKLLVAISGSLLFAVTVGWFILRHHPASQTAILTVQSSPSGADIEVNGLRCTQRPCTFTLPASKAYDVTATLDGYSPARQHVSLTKDETIEMNLISKANPAPSSVNNVPVSVSSHLLIKGIHPGDQILVDDIPLSKAESSGGWNIAPGYHRLSMKSGKEELVAEAGQFKPDSNVVLSRSDFKLPTPPASDEQVAWQRVESTQDPGQLESFLKRYPGSSVRSRAESQLEQLYWLQASRNETIQGLKEYLAKYPSPNGPHYQMARDALDRLEWRELQNSTNVAQLNDFLRRHPSGPYHDSAAARLDELSWNQAKTTDTSDSIRQYLSTNPAGKHRDEAQAELGRLTPRGPSPSKPSDNPAPSKPSDNPAPSKSSDSPAPSISDTSSARAVTTDNAAILRVLDAYKDAYEAKSVEQLRSIWPAMNSSQTSGLEQLFKNYDQVSASYNVISGPTIAGNTATVTIIQQIDVVKKKAHFPNKNKVTIVLKKDGSSWFINSIK